MNGYWLRAIVGALILAMFSLGGYAVALDREKADKVDVERLQGSVGQLLEAVKVLTLNNCLETHEKEYCLEIYRPNGRGKNR